jgi:hypothetical protein
MKSVLNWRILLGLLLVFLSASLYFLHYGIFHDAHHIFIYLLGDIAFVPIEVLLVTLIIHQLLEKRSKKILLKKLNMLIGTFFSECGNQLLEICAEMDTGRQSFSDLAAGDGGWGDGNLSRVSNLLRTHKYDLAVRRSDLERLVSLLASKRQFLVNLLANPNLLEHDDFTDVLWAVFHLTEELDSREKIRSVPDSDLEHLSGGIRRAYRFTAEQWVSYMQHLNKEYPYLFSLAMRKNPFDPHRVVTVV